MAKKILTLDIGAANIALAEYELGAKGAIKLLKYGVAELASPLDGGNVETILAPALREIIGAKGFKPGKLALAENGLDLSDILPASGDTAGVADLTGNGLETQIEELCLKILLCNKLLYIIIFDFKCYDI